MTQLALNFSIKNNKPYTMIVLVKRNYPYGFYNVHQAKKERRLKTKDKCSTEDQLRITAKTNMPGCYIR